MQYYSLKEACATKETGPQYPQIQKWKKGYDEDSATSYYSYYNASKRGEIFPDFIPDMDALVMHSKAKPTDLVSSPISIGFVVNTRLKSIFQQFNLPPHRFYQTNIIYKAVQLSSYYLMHTISKYYEDYLDCVDYKNSSFVVSGVAKNNIEHITLISKQDYLYQSKLLQKKALDNKLFRSISADRICFNENFNKNLDYFSAPFGTIYYISQRLKDAIIAANIKGCEISTDNKIVVDK